MVWPTNHHKRWLAPMNAHHRKMATQRHMINYQSNNNKSMMQQPVASYLTTTVGNLTSPLITLVRRIREKETTTPQPQLLQHPPQPSSGHANGTTEQIAPVFPREERREQREEDIEGSPTSDPQASITHGIGLQENSPDFDHR